MACADSGGSATGAKLHAVSCLAFRRARLQLRRRAGMRCGYLDVSVMSPVLEIGFRKARLLLLARALARRPHVVQILHPCGRLVLLACRSVSRRPDVADKVLPWKFLLSLPRIGWTWDLAVLCMPETLPTASAARAAGFFVSF